MSAAHDDVLAKMDALLKKHHDGLTQAPGVDKLPVLTEVVEDEPELIPVLTEVVEIVAEPAPIEEYQAADAPHAVTPDAPHEILDPHALALLEQQISAHIVAAMDKSLAVMLDQFGAHLESLVRETVARELQTQLPELLRQGKRGAAPEQE